MDARQEQGNGPWTHTQPGIQLIQRPVVPFQGDRIDIDDEAADAARTATGNDRLDRRDHLALDARLVEQFGYHGGQRRIRLDDQDKAIGIAPAAEGPFAAGRPVG